MALWQKVHFAIFWIFRSKMKITQADAPTIWIHTNWCPHLCHPHHFMQDAFPYTTLPVYPGWGQVPNMLACIPGGLVAYLVAHTKQHKSFWVAELNSIGRMTDLIWVLTGAAEVGIDVVSIATTRSVTIACTAHNARVAASRTSCNCHKSVTLTLLHTQTSVQSSMI